MTIRARLVLPIGLLLAVACAAPEKPPRPNVLFLISDDLAAQSLGCYGNDQCRTPAIDSLASRGVRFTRAYSQFPACASSRAALMSGMYPQAIGVMANWQAERFTRNLGQRPSMSGLFKDHGWHTARVSKIYHMRVPGDIRKGTHGFDHEASWTERYSLRAPEWKTEGEKTYLTRRKGTFRGDEHFAGAFTIVRGKSAGAEQVDALAADKAIEIIEKQKDKPFFLAVGFIRPHLPLVAPAPYFEPYPADEMRLPERIEDDWADIPRLGISLHSKNMDLTTDAMKRQVLSAYYASVAFMDAQVGRVLKALDDHGLRDSTIVVFTSDHGYHLGEHELWQKGSLHEESTRIPLIVAGPGIETSETDALAQLIDIYPTLAELAGLDVPKHLQGKSLMPALRDPKARVHEEVFSTLGYGNLLRTERWAFLSWRDGTAELYDMDQDPHQFTNLAERPEHAGIVREMRDRLKRKLAEIGEWAESQV